MPINPPLTAPGSPSLCAGPAGDNKPAAEPKEKVVFLVSGAGLCECMLRVDQWVAAQSGLVRCQWSNKRNQNLTTKTSEAFFPNVAASVAKFQVQQGWKRGALPAATEAANDFESIVDVSICLKETGQASQSPSVEAYPVEEHAAKRRKLGVDDSGPALNVATTVGYSTQVVIQMMPPECSKNDSLSQSKKYFWLVVEAIKCDLQRTSRKWRRRMKSQQAHDKSSKSEQASN